MIGNYESMGKNRFVDRDGFFSKLVPLAFTKKIFVFHTFVSSLRVSNLIRFEYIRDLIFILIRCNKIVRIYPFSIHRLHDFNLTRFEKHSQYCPSAFLGSSTRSAADSVRFFRLRLTQATIKQSFFGYFTAPIRG